jgi:hypothetical protein
LFEETNTSYDRKRGGKRKETKQIDQKKKRKTKTKQAKVNPILLRSDILKILLHP